MKNQQLFLEIEDFYEKLQGDSQTIDTSSDAPSTHQVYDALAFISRARRTVLECPRSRPWGEYDEHERNKRGYFRNYQTQLGWKLRNCTSQA
jgi:hypothetical protein